MQNFQAWKNEKNVDPLNPVELTTEELVRLCLEYFGSTIRGSMKSYFEHAQENIVETVETSRYAIEVNYRTTIKEVLEGNAKLVLGYVSAALKNHGYHTKHIFTEKPLRLLVTSRNWEDGSWVGIITWNAEHACFVLSKGFYNKDRKSVSYQNSKKCSGDSASEIARELHNTMHSLKNQKDRTGERIKLKKVPLKPGPKS